MNAATAAPGHDRWLLVVLAFVAGLVDVTGYLSFDQLFAAHVTGNLVLLAAGVKSANPPAIARILVLPVFAVSLVIGYFAARRWPEGRGRAVLLWGQTLLLALVCLSMLLSRVSLRSPELVLIAAMLAVAAMGLQCAFVRIGLHESQGTTVMTSNFITVVISAVTLVCPGPEGAAQAREKLRRTLPIVLAFVAGCSLAALGVARVGAAWAWVIPVLASMLALGAARPESAREVFHHSQPGLRFRDDGLRE